jgi:hypothetical protein
VETEETAEDLGKIELENVQTGPAMDESQREEITDADAQEQYVELTSRVRGNRFVHGLSVGLGIGCIGMFVIMWLTVFFMPQIPTALTYERLLSIFIYPLVYLLAVGLVALTAGIVKEYYMRI